MTDHPIPDDLLDIIERALDPYDMGPRDTVEERYEPALAIQRALASWADGHLIDPDGWRRVKAERTKWGLANVLDPAPHVTAVDCAGEGCVPLVVLTPAPEKETSDG